VLIKPYKFEELKFAWCYRVYYRWGTHRGRTQAALAQLDQVTLDAMLQPYGIRILEAAADQAGVKMLASLLPDETVAGCAGKAKGRTSKWLRETTGLQTAQKLLGRGYFACTTGKSSAEAVDRYLSAQGTHHGYATRARPPIFVERYPFTPADEQRLTARHAVTVLQLHVVLSTWRRKGVFGQMEGHAVTARWRQMQDEWQTFLEKVSFVPDHVHLAVRIHPKVSPARLVLGMMNAAQELLWEEFAESVIRAGADRLWQSSAYIGLYGDAQSAAIAAYLRRWEQDRHP
jgi:REP element-mobilizing transposase RayT